MDESREQRYFETLKQTSEFVRYGTKVFTEMRERVMLLQRLAEEWQEQSDAFLWLAEHGTFPENYVHGRDDLLEAIRLEGGVTGLE